MKMDDEAMEFVVDQKYIDQLKKIEGKAKKYHSLYNCDLGATLYVELDDRQIRAWYSSRYETKQSAYSFKDIKRCEIYSNGCMLLFRDKNLIFLPVTDHEENDIALIEFCEVLESELDRAHFFLIERLSILDAESGKRIKVGFSLGDFPLGMFIAAVIAIVIATIFVMMKNDFAPVERAECKFYAGTFEKYHRDSKDYIELRFTDGETFEIHQACATQKVLDGLDAARSGEEMKIALNPNVDYVVEVIAGDQELLNFEGSQKAMLREATAFMWLGIFLYGGAGNLIGYGIYQLIREKKANKM